MQKYINIVECAIQYQEKFLLITRPEHKLEAPGLLCFAGGKVDENDQMLAEYDVLRMACKREIKEELGLILEKPLEYITSHYFSDSQGNSVINSIFYYRYDFLPLITPDPVEVPAYKWLSIQEVNLATNVESWLKNYLLLIKQLKN